VIDDMPDRLWVYRATFERVVDGDTIDVRVDAGFRNYRRERVRLLGVNAPESRGPSRDDGQASRVYVETWLQTAEMDTADDHWPLILETSKSDVFGRWLATLWRVSDGECLNIEILQAGYAVPDLRRTP
jgi:endonuclease YncB( thermonuclease family)